VHGVVTVPGPRALEQREQKRIEREAKARAAAAAQREQEQAEKQRTVPVMDPRDPDRPIVSRSVPAKTPSSAPHTPRDDPPQPRPFWKIFDL